MTLTERGIAHAEKLLGWETSPTSQHGDPPCRQPGLRAHVLFKLDVDTAQDGEVVIVDEFTGGSCRSAVVGRPAPGGGGQEGVKIERENQTLATITFQNYFACTTARRHDGYG